MDIFIKYAPVAGLLFFFCVFVGITIWAWRPSAKKEFQRLGMILPQAALAVIVGIAERVLGLDVGLLGAGA